MASNNPRGAAAEPSATGPVTDTGDAELIAAVRGGDTDAYATLYERHVDAARRLARQLVTPSDAEDLVAEAFTKVLVVLQRGDGPDLAFRAYLLTSIRRLHIDRIRATAKVQPTDDLTPFEPTVPFVDTAVEGFDNAAAAEAFRSLPERWQVVLWHTEVEGQKPADIAPILGMSPNSVAALAYRAREGLRQAFLSHHAAEIEDDRCRWTQQQLGGYVRDGLSRRDTAKVQAHLDDCRRCMGVYLELVEVNSELAALLAPLLLGGTLGAAYLASTTGALTGAVGGGTVLGGLGKSVTTGLDRIKDQVAANTGLGVAASVATVAVTAGLVLGGAQLLTGSPDRVTAQDVPTSLAPGGTVLTGSPESATASSPSSATSRATEAIRRQAERRRTQSPGTVLPPWAPTAPVTQLTGPQAPTGPVSPAAPTSSDPSGTPTSSPTADPSTSGPSTTPTTEPSVEPSSRPTSDGPSSTPSTSPSTSPSVSTSPSTSPSGTPSTTPTAEPSSTTSAEPSSTASAEPTSTASSTPSTTPSSEPTPVLPDPWVSLTPRDTYYVMADLHDVPAGVEPTVQITFVGRGLVTTLDSRCSEYTLLSGDTMTCSLTGGPVELNRVLAVRGGTITISFNGDGGEGDLLSNNRATHVIGQSTP